MGKTADFAGTGGERQLQRGGLDADAQSSAAPGVRGEHVVHAVQQEHRRTVPGRLGEQAVHQSVVHDAAAGQELPAAIVVVIRIRRHNRERPCDACLLLSVYNKIIV